MEYYAVTELADLGGQARERKFSLHATFRKTLSHTNASTLQRSMIKLEQLKNDNFIRLSFSVRLLAGTEIIFLLFLFKVYFIDYAITVSHFFSPLYSPLPCIPLSPTSPPLVHVHGLFM